MRKEIRKGRKLQNVRLQNLYSLKCIIKVISCTCSAHGKLRNAYNISVGNLEESRH
jgi:hypothetical protein